MRLYTFELNQHRRIGAECQGQIVDLAAACQAASINQTPEPHRLRALPNELLTFIRLGAPALEAAAVALAHARRRRAVPVGEEILFPLEAVRLRAPILRPGKIMWVSEVTAGLGPANRRCFPKVSSALIGPSESISKPATVNQLRSEPNIAAVIGSRVKNIAETNVTSAICGYTILNSISAGDPQFTDNPTLAGNFDTFCPLGPCIVTADEFPTAHNGQLRVHLNGGLKQSVSVSTTSLNKQIAYLSTIMTLEAGDVVGTPCLGNNADIMLNVGDSISLEIDGIGRLENSIIAES